MLSILSDVARTDRSYTIAVVTQICVSEICGIQPVERPMSSRIAFAAFSPYATA